ncbi:outer membrane protein [Bradyrhizobium sp.]|uniref:outer membrane protein n=1 Tax=Bradyrhizobium sp. TaxID=376 RepID=UPI0039E24373
MNKLACGILAFVLGTSAAVAADLAPRSPAKEPTPPVGFNWSGLYGGLHAGWVGSDVSVLDNVADGIPGGPFKYIPSGGFGGGQFGYNWQIGGAWLVGVEGDVGYMGFSGKGRIGSSIATAHQDLELSSAFYADATARLGYAIVPQTLIYAKGGWAYFDGASSQTTTNPGFVTNAAEGLNGWTVGAGVEHFLTPAVSVKVEYQYFDFGSKNEGNQTSISDPPVGHVYRNWTDLTMSSVKAGLNYHFSSF